VTTIHHINGGTLHVPSYPTVVCHCLLLQEGKQLALVDTGIGLEDVRNPVGRLEQPLIAMAGFQFHEPDTAVRRIETLGFDPDDVRHLILTHGDPDHAGGLADFPNARVHISEEEDAQIARGHGRYVPTHFAHGPSWKICGPSTRKWFGLEARSIEAGFSSEVLLIPLFGHTLGHCGVAVEQNGRWFLHVGAAYYLRAELSLDDHPVSAIATQRADDDAQRRASLVRLRQFVRDHGDEVDLIGYYDRSEFPADYPLHRDDGEDRSRFP
jgi:glyoxylase-like metal-dependent hydrolase (beta-lactamase superfamily II)